MTNYRISAMTTVLIASTVLVTLNAIAVATGAADSFYTEIHNWITANLSQ